MSDGNYTRFRLNLQFFTIELAGEKTFVEELYRKVYRDLLPLLNTPKPTEAAIDPKPEESPSKARLEYTWIYSCTPHYNKVYVVENAIMTHSIFGRVLNPKSIRRIYIERNPESAHLFREVSAGNRTLWAEITPEGRRMIEEAANVPTTSTQE